MEKYQFTDDKLCIGNFQYKSNYDVRQMESLDVANGMFAQSWRSVSASKAENCEKC